MSDSVASEFVAPASLARCLPRAMRRRLASYWGRLTGPLHQPTAEAAFDSLAQALGRIHSQSRRETLPCVVTLGRAIAMAAGLDELPLAAAWSQTMLAMQSADGSFLDGGARPS